MSTGEHHRLRTGQAAEYLGCSPRTLEKWRIEGGGPPYIELSSRLIVYDTNDLDRWLASKRRGPAQETVT